MSFIQMELSSGETILLVLCLLLVVYEAVVVILIVILINWTNKAKAKRDQKLNKENRHKLSTDYVKVDANKTDRKESLKEISVKKLDSTQSSGISSIQSIFDEKSSDQQMAKPEINMTSNADNQRLADQQILNLPKTPTCSLNTLTGSLAESHPWVPKKTIQSVRKIHIQSIQSILLAVLRREYYLSESDFC